MSENENTIDVVEVEPGIFQVTETTPTRGGGTNTQTYPLDVATAYARIAAWEGRRKEMLSQVTSGDEAVARLKVAVKTMEGLRRPASE